MANLKALVLAVWPLATAQSQSDVCAFRIFPKSLYRCEECILDVIYTGIVSIAVISDIVRLPEPYIKS